MTTDTASWEPPVAGTEVEHLTAALDRLRTTFRWKADGVDAAGLALTVGASTMTLGGLLKHLALVEDYYFTAKLAGQPLGAPWAEADLEADPDWEWHSAADDPWDLLVARFRDSVARADAELDAVLATPEGLDTLALRTRHGKAASVRWILVHLVEEYARHCGHADLIRESLDGATDL